MSNDGKYLLAYVLPASAFLAVYMGGLWSFLAFAVAFVIIPSIELILPPKVENWDEGAQMSRQKRKIFDWFLYLNLPIVYGIVCYAVWRIVMTPVAPYEIAGMILSAGVIVGTGGINVAHELGHRQSIAEQWIARLLLTPAMYTHFTIEHNFGHHKHVGTPEDPATARRGEPVYAFWFRSMAGTLRNAWRIQRVLLAKQGVAFWDLRSNKVLLGAILQVVFLAVLGAWMGVAGILIALAVALVGILLLESVNYIEHYGLTRGKLPSGRYEPIAPTHSWNSDHQLGRIFLYELTRHSDHHFKSTRKYQILRHLDESPQLPFGYPASIVLSLLPPLWTRVMDKRLP